MEAEAVTNAKLDNLQSAGSISFSLKGSNSTAVNVSAQVADPNDLSGLVTAINDHSGETGITAKLDDQGAVILNSSEGDDISIASYSGGSMDMTALGSDQAEPAGGGTADTLSTSGNTAGSVRGVVDFHSDSNYAITTDQTGATELLSNSTNASSLQDVGSIDIGTQAGAADAMKKIDGAISYIDSQRANLGAVMNRFDSTISNLQNISENVSSARSRIMDADIATETSNMTKQNILQQAGVSILAQANQQPQLALSLLGG